uniref:Nucleotide-diphospho-sugar transferase domain-containing protein n=1 Tax=Alexandrium monilatum TaxID=311494 RepID=A0A7S4WH00_9DINO
MGQARRGQHSPWSALLSHVCGILAVVVVFGLPLALQRFWPVLTYGVLKIVASAARPRSCSCPVDADAARARRRDAIVLLVQKKRWTKLMNSLADLQKHFNVCFRKDVLLFHNGDFTIADQTEVKKHYPLVQFHYLADGGKYWKVPPGLENRSAWGSTKGYSAGYRHMTRFHYKMVFEYLEERGYDWFMRLDDDSFILSCIEYDVFQFMEDNDHLYAWRLAQLEYRDFAKLLPEMADAHMRRIGAPMSHEMHSHYDGGQLSTASWDRWTYYNNFMVTRISWWRSRGIQQWLEMVDTSGIAYLSRVGDAPIQTFTRMMFMSKKHVHHFQDWSYHHGPIIALSLGSLLPTWTRPFLPEGAQRFEWIGGQPDMMESGSTAPLVFQVNVWLASLGIDWWL